ncbi:hypothetical protein [Pedobacter antarcticus]|uniref:hypothetical protein n=1 Tax=Pedobacter antarcticus TaxID=34086 RepID=UPI002930D03F|nr:hypothetical protein [Pedobacter antarcticus]
MSKNWQLTSYRKCPLNIDGEALDAENEAIDQGKKAKVSFHAQVLPNRDTLKQLLAGSRYILYKKPQDW